MRYRSFTPSQLKRMTMLVETPRPPETADDIANSASAARNMSYGTQFNCEQENEKELRK